MTEMERGWTWPELCEAVQQPVVAGPQIRQIVVDSRLIQQGDLFVALPGDPGARFNPSQRTDNDGHRYLGEARSAGAHGALVASAGLIGQAPPDDWPLLTVTDTYDALWQLGAAGRARIAGPVVAITGSSGKTTAKTFLGHALQAYAAPGSFNNHIGVPLSLANHAPRAAPGVFEIGTNHAGEIEPLAQMCRPDLAIVLNVHQAHIENFSDWDALKEEKLSIYNALDDKSMAISEDLLRVDFGQTYGFSADASARVTQVDDDRCTIEMFGETLSAAVPGGGEHRALAVAATVLAVKMLGHDIVPALSLPADLVPTGRGNWVVAGGVRIVDDSYNANPASMRAAIEGFLAQSGEGARIGVLGEMLELGDVSARAHGELAELLPAFDQVYCVGAGMRELARVAGATWFESADEALVDALSERVSAPDRVLVKGSNRVFWARGFVAALTRAIGNK